MPQISKGGKFIFGWSVVQDDLGVRIPDRATCEYGLSRKVSRMSGSRTSGAFSVSSRELLYGTRYAGLLEPLTEVLGYSLQEGIPVKHKNRYYCWASLGADNRMVLTKVAADAYGVKPGDILLTIRGSDIAFDFAVKGPLVELAKGHPEIPVYR